MLIQRVVQVASSVLVGLSIAACSSSQSPGQSSGVPPVADANSGATLTVEPATVDGCKPNEPIVATVSWHSNVSKVKVMVAAPAQSTPQLFSESGYAGSAKTGTWVVAGTTFILVDAGTAKQLATRTVTATKCG